MNKIFALWATPRLTAFEWEYPPLNSSANMVRLYEASLPPSQALKIFACV